MFGHNADHFCEPNTSAVDTSSGESTPCSRGTRIMSAQARSHPSFVESVPTRPGGRAPCRRERALSLAERLLPLSCPTVEAGAALRPARAPVALRRPADARLRPPAAARDLWRCALVHDNEPAHRRRQGGGGDDAGVELQPMQYALGDGGHAVGRLPHAPTQRPGAGARTDGGGGDAVHHARRVEMLSSKLA